MERWFKALGMEFLPSNTLLFSIRCPLISFDETQLHGPGYGVIRSPTTMGTWSTSPYIPDILGMESSYAGFGMEIQFHIYFISVVKGPCPSPGNRVSSWGLALG